MKTDSEKIKELAHRSLNSNSISDRYGLDRLNKLLEDLEEQKNSCKNCGGKGYTEQYFDGGDHFGAGSSPFSEWTRVPCKSCKPKDSSNY